MPLGINFNNNQRLFPLFREQRSNKIVDQKISTVSQVGINAKKSNLPDKRVKHSVPGSLNFTAVIASLFIMAISGKYAALNAFNMNEENSCKTYFVATALSFFAIGSLKASYHEAEIALAQKRVSKKGSDLFEALGCAIQVIRAASGRSNALSVAGLSAACLTVIKYGNAGALEAATSAVAMAAFLTSSLVCAGALASS